MKKIKMSRGISLIFEEGCNKYLENCRQGFLSQNQMKSWIRHLEFILVTCPIFLYVKPQNFANRCE